MYIEETLLDVLKETDLMGFERKLCVELQLSRLEHFDHISDDELMSYAGLSLPAIRRLRQTIADKKKKTKKSKGIFSTIARKEGREVAKVMVAAASAPTDTPASSQGSTCLINKDQVKLMERIGEGSFAVVKRGIWMRPDGQKIDVAVKVLRESSSEIIDDLQQEVNNMQKLQHPNLIRLYGIVFSNPAMMVVEFCEGGSLVDRLRASDKPVLLISSILDYAQQIAKGMAYLESKHCVHRDLAARNVLLADNEKAIKICDFGLMRALEDNERLYVMSAQKKIPFAWCPPESLRFRQFSHASDVWSFGVTLWELFSYGEEPWAGLRGAEVLTKLEAGERLQRPTKCSVELFDLIMTCWSNNVNMRPRFSLLKGILSDIKFMIAECREQSFPSKDVDLELKVNDRVIVIEGSGVIWYGQNVRTRGFGRFLRSSIHATSERSSVVKGGVLSPIQTQNNGSERISHPVPGSFIHAGHGDIVPGQSWGQPERIDDIYLKNPIMRKDRDIKDENTRRIGPQFIPSVIDLQPASFRWSTMDRPSDDKPLPAKKPKPSSSPGKMPDSELPNNVNDQLNDRTPYSTTAVDPFAPFSEYYSDAFDENSFDNSWNPPTSSAYNTAPPNSKPTPVTYDQPPPSEAGRSDQYCLSSYYNLADNSNRQRLNGVRPADVPTTSTESSAVNSAAPVSRLAAPPENAGNSKNRQYVSLPRPMRSSPDLTVANGTSINGRPPPGATPPPIRASNFTDQKPSSALNMRTPLGNLTQSSYAPKTTDDSSRLLNQSKFNGASEAPTLPGISLSDAKLKQGNGFRATSYIAATGREAYSARPLSISSQNQLSKEALNSAILKGPTTATGFKPSVPASTSIGTVTKETVFGAKPQEITASVGQISFGHSQQTSFPVSGSSTSRPLSKGATGTVSDSSLMPGVSYRSHEEGPDPFEVSPSVKKIVNSRYSEVFCERPQQLPHMLPVESAVVGRTPVATTIPAKQTTESFPKPIVQPIGLPPPSPLLLGNAVTNNSNVHTPAYSSVINASSSKMTGGSSTADNTPRAITLPSSSKQLAVTQVELSDLGNADLRYSSSSISSHGSTASYSGGHSSQVTTNILGQHIPNQMFYPPQPRILSHRDSTPILSGYAPVDYTIGMSSRLGYGYNNALPASNGNSAFRTPYYWTGLPEDSLQKGMLGLQNNRTALVYDANLSNSSRSLTSTNRPYISGISLSGSRQATTSGGVENRQRNSLVNDEILGLFDPLTPAPSVTNISTSTTNVVTPKGVDPIDAVMKDAKFAGRDKCASMLQRCNNDILKAVRELKTAELIAMGVARDRQQALNALEDCRWDINAAAEALIT